MFARREWQVREFLPEGARGGLIQSVPGSIPIPRLIQPTNRRATNYRAGGSSSLARCRCYTESHLDPRRPPFALIRRIATL